MRAASAVFIALVAMGASDAEAQDPRERARELFMEGVQHLADGENEEAIADLEAARDIYATASIHFNLGLAYRSVRRFVDGIDAFERFLVAVGEGGDPARIEEARKYMRSMRAGLGRIRLDVAPAQARIRIDGEPVARETTVVQVDPGTHRIVATAPGYLEAESTVEVSAGGDRLVQLSLESSEHIGRLTIDVDPDAAEIRVDGRPLGTGDRTLSLAVGLHEVEAEHRGDVERREVEILEDETLALTLNVRPRRRRRLIAIGVVAAVLIGAAAGVGGWYARNPRTQAPLEPPLGNVTTALGVGR